VSVDIRKIRGLKGGNHDRAARALAGREKGAMSGRGVLSVGRALGARWVVWGGFQNVGPALRITPQFAETETEELISAAKIDGPIQEIFALQDRIVTGLMDILNIKLSSHDLERIGRPQTAELQAYEYYAKGRQAADRAVVLDPDSTFAYYFAGLNRAVRGAVEHRWELYPEAAPLLVRATAVEPLFQPAYIGLGWIYMLNGQYDVARTAFDRAV